MAVHQLIPCFTPFDAMGQAAVSFRKVLRRLGHHGELYAAEVAPAWRRLVKPASALRPRRGDLVLYHHGIASPLSSAMMHLPCRRGVVFHNITPARFYEGTLLHESLVAGRAQISALAPACDVSIGVSNFNSDELRAAGHQNVHTVPLFIEPERFELELADAKMQNTLSGRRPMLLSVSRVVPHKRMDDVLSLFAELRRIHPEARLVIVGAMAEGHRDVKALKARAKEIGRVFFLGRLNHAELVATYQAADLFVSMSEHEGFGVPVIEAFATETPVIAFAAAAVPEVMGGAGVAFTEKRFALLAELASALSTDSGLRAQILKGQRARAAEFSIDATEQAMGVALEKVVPRRVRKRARGKRVAVVVQRYGEELVGGAESHARQVALRLAADFEVTVLSTCAKDHLTWENEYPEGTVRDGPLTVKRYASEATREMRAFNRLSRPMFERANDLVAEENWIAEQGPANPALLDAIATGDREFDAYIFFTYLYTPTVWGLPSVAKKALLVPTAHDEPPFTFQTYADVFRRPRALLVNTVEELKLIQDRYPGAARGRVVGVGVDVPTPRPERFRKATHLEGDYLVSVSRQEEGKGIPDLVDTHNALAEQDPDLAPLVLVGDGPYVARGPRIHRLGRIADHEKFDAMAGALAVVVPSKLESLSLVTLEAFAVGTPVIGRADCEVVAGHIQRSGGGVVYDDDDSFADAVRRIAEARVAFSERALKYARRFRWAQVMRAYREELEAIMRDNA